MEGEYRPFVALGGINFAADNRFWGFHTPCALRRPSAYDDLVIEIPPSHCFNIRVISILKRFPPAPPRYYRASLSEKKSPSD